jgi:hypothetical protein
VERGAAKHESCAVCGRTILKGERAWEYVTPQGQHVGVCALCRAPAEAEGWIRAEDFRSAGRAPSDRPRRGQALRKRLGQAAAKARSTRQEAGEKRSARAEQATRPAPRPAPSQRAEPEAAPAQPAASKPSIIRSPEAVIKRAVERFNGSAERRKVAGLIRSLGEPRAAILPDPRSQTALVTVAWELSWYQWEVGVNGESEPVREIAKGNELSELDADARAWNAAVAESGELRLAS